jgi:hypothetical protein
MGAVKTRFVQITPELLAQVDQRDFEFFKYECTEFGRAVFRESINRSGLDSPEMRAALNERFGADLQ